MDELSKKIGSFWDNKLKATKEQGDALRRHWWEDPHTLRHINRIVCGEPLDGMSAGFHRRIGQILSGRGIKKPRAISIGAGSGMKEIWLLQSNAVATVDAYELGPGMVEEGRRLAKQYGMEDRMQMHLGSPLEEIADESYDLVYWNNALHHMPDTPAALTWSHGILKPGGLLAFDDYVGPNRFQFSDELIDRVNQITTLIPDRLLGKVGCPGEKMPKRVSRWDPAVVEADDPSEAPDSGRILPALHSTFPEAEVIPTGGAIYFLALNHLFGNFDSEEDIALLNLLLLADRLLAERFETPYTVAFASRSC